MGGGSLLDKLEIPGCSEKEALFGSLPEGFIADALSLTSPRDACRLSLVDSVFRSAAEWDAVWESFLPPDYQNILGEAVDGGIGGSKKDLFLRLCDHPILIDGGNKSFSLDKQSGKKCYMLAARDLTISWGDTPDYWGWISIPESRFAEVAELISVCWLEVHGQISTSLLSPNTTYVAYLVFKETPKAHGFQSQPVEVSVGLRGLECQTRMMYLDSQAGQRRKLLPRRRTGLFNRGVLGNRDIAPPPSKDLGPKERGDGWLEIELGEYFNREGEAGELEMSMTEVKGGNWKGGLIILGIEIRPKACKETNIMASSI